MRAPDFAAFAHALCHADAAIPPFVRAPAGAVVAERFAVHRNNVHVSLVEALAQGYPVVRAQVGEEFFRAMARAFVQVHKPGTAQLSAYGAEFPGFIAGFGPAAALPWLRDLARLERCWTESWAAPDAATLPITALQRMSPEDLLRARIVAHPAARVVRSAWPIASVWEAHQAAQPDLSSLSFQPQSVLLTRPQADVLLRRLDDHAAQFCAALLRGEAIESAAQHVPQTDVGPLLALFIDAGMIMEL